jgi:hypothetical protein
MFTIALIKGHALTVVAVKTCKLNCYLFISELQEALSCLL